MKLQRYLGDGVYAGFDGFHIWVWTDRESQNLGDDRFSFRHSIAFEPEVLASLAKYTADLKRMAHDAESLNQEQI